MTVQSFVFVFVSADVRFWLISANTRKHIFSTQTKRGIVDRRQFHDGTLCDAIVVEKSCRMFGRLDSPPCIVDRTLCSQDGIFKPVIVRGACACPCKEPAYGCWCSSFCPLLACSSYFSFYNYMFFRCRRGSIPRTRRSQHRQQAI